MALTDAFGLIVAASVKNRVVRQVKRLRQPRYLVATAIGVAYWWFYLGRFWINGVTPRNAVPAEARPLFVAGGTVLLTAIALVGWFVGSDQSRVTFTEAEVQFLFPAPTTRRQLLHYKLMRSVLVGLISALVYTIFLRRASGRPLFMTAGGWIAVTTLSLHWTAASFVRKSLAEHGVTGLKRTVFRIAGFGAFLTLVAVAVAKTPRPDEVEPTLSSALAWGAVVTTPPLGWVLWPIRAAVRLAFAQDLGEFAQALPAAVGVLLVHYFWVIRTAESFEDDAVASAERRARWREARRSGQYVVPEQNRRPPFKLGASGRPEVALAWRNLIRISRVLRVRFFFFLFPMVTVAGIAGYVLRNGHPGAAQAVISGTALSLYALVIFFGPVLMRSSLADPEATEMLKSAPLSGVQIVTGETLAQLATLAAFQWLLVVPAVLLLPGDVGLADLGQRAAVIVALAVLGPALSLGGILVQNAAAVLVPGWIAPERERSRGPEAMGMRMLVLLGNLIAVGVAVVPAALIGGAVGFLLWTFLGWGALPIASTVSAATLVVESGLAVALLGKAFDRYDLSAG